MTRPLPALLCAAAFLLVRTPALANDLSSLLRDLNALQNRMVIGDAAARDQAARQFEVIEQAIDAADPAVWTDERNVRAAVVYLLCGGAAPKLRKLYDAGKGEMPLNALLGASLDYAEGRDSGAPNALVGFDPKDFQQILGGHLALVQAGALIGQDNARAVALLDLARLLMPGSLVEEAALRREIALLDPVGDIDKLALLALRYAAHYGHSPYAKNFWDALLRATIEEPGFLPAAPKFAGVFDKAPAAIRTSAYLTLARQALTAGKLQSARQAVEKAEVGADPASRKRVDLYRGILSALAEQDPDRAAGKIDPAPSNKEDAALAAMATSVVSALASRSTQAPGKDDSYEMLSTVRRAIADSDQLLKRAQSR